VANSSNTSYEPDPRAVSHPIQIALRIVLAGIFVYAAAPKLLHSDQFAENILDYGLLPAQSVNILALWLPMFELLVGLAVLIGFWTRASALAMIGMSALFLGALVWVQSGPTPLPCSCFSTDPGAPPRTWFSLWQEGALVLLAAALWVSHWPPRTEPLIHMRKRQAVGLAVASLVVFALMIGIVALHHQQTRQSASSAVQTGTTTAATKPLPRMLDFGEPNCQACLKMAPALEELTRQLEGKVAIEFVDITKNEQYIQKYDLVAVPTQIFFDAQGKQVGRHEGVLTKDQALAQLRKLGLL
jgi:thioredoxin 1